MVVTQQLVKEVNGLVANEPLIVGIHEAVPGLLLKAAQDIIILCIQLNLVLIQVVKQIISAENLSDLDELIRVRATMEKRFFPEDHGCEHGTQTPHVQAVVVLLEINEQFRTLEVTRGHAHVVLGSRMVKFGQTPVNQAELYHVSECSEISDGKKVKITFLFS